MLHTLTLSPGKRPLRIMRYHYPVGREPVRAGISWRTGFVAWLSYGRGFVALYRPTLADMYRTNGRGPL